MLKNDEYTILSYAKNNFLCEFVIGDRFLKKTEGSRNYHFHSSHEVHICVGGKIHVTVEDKSYELGPCDLAVIAPGVSHYVALDEGACSMGFKFRFSYYGKDSCEEQTLFSRAFCSGDEAIIRRGSELLEKYVSHASENIKNSGSPTISAGLLFLSLCELADGVLGNEYENSATENRHNIALCENIEHFVNTHYNKKTSLCELAAHINLGNRQTERIVKKLFGMTWCELICQKRISAAKLLLRTTRQSLDKISDACGFEDKSYFCRRFTSVVGISPGQYRSDCRKV